MTSTSVITSKLEERFKPEHLVGTINIITITSFLQEVKDVSEGCGQSFEVVIVTEEFKGKGLLQRHRLVNDCLATEISQIHAFTQKTYTPEQWTAMNK